MRKIRYNLTSIGLIMTLFFHFANAAISDPAEVNRKCLVGGTYNLLTLSAKYFAAYRKIQTPTVINFAWWGTIASQDGGLIDALNMGLDSYQICVSSKENHNTDCYTAVSDTVKIIIANVVKVAVGWNANAMVNGAIKITGPDAVKRSLGAHPYCAIRYLTVTMLHLLFLICLRRSVVYIIGRMSMW